MNKNQYQISQTVFSKTMLTTGGSYSIPSNILFYLGAIFNSFQPSRSIPFTFTFVSPHCRKTILVATTRRTKKVTNDVKELLIEISSACAECQEFGPRPYSFRASTPLESILFNAEIAMYLIWLENLFTCYVHSHSLRKCIVYKFEIGQRYGDRLHGILEYFL